MRYTLVNIISIRMIDNNTFRWISSKIRTRISYLLFLISLTQHCEQYHHTSSQQYSNPEYHVYVKFDKHDKHPLDVDNYNNHLTQQQVLQNYLLLYNQIEENLQERLQDIDALHKDR